MQVKVKIRSISTSKGFCRNGDIVDLPRDEVEKILALRPSILEILPELELEAPKPAPVKRTTRKKTNVKSIN